MILSIATAITELRDLHSDLAAELDRHRAENPNDVRRLVIAARKVAFEDQSREALKELDKASEAFALRVPWDDEPRAISDYDGLGVCCECGERHSPLSDCRKNRSDHAGPSPR